MGTRAASEPLNFFIIVIYDLCIGDRSYRTEHKFYLDLSIKSSLKVLKGCYLIWACQRY